jgi:hypothetical protein
VLLTAAIVDAGAVGVSNTNLARHKLFARIFYAVTALISKSEPQGAATNVYCAFGEVEGGAYYAGVYALQLLHVQVTEDLKEQRLLCSERRGSLCQHHDY